MTYCGQQSVIAQRADRGKRKSERSENAHQRNKRGGHVQADLLYVQRFHFFLRVRALTHGDILLRVCKLRHGYHAFFKPQPVYTARDLPVVGTEAFEIKQRRESSRHNDESRKREPQSVFFKHPGQNGCRQHGGKAYDEGKQNGFEPSFLFKPFPVPFKQLPVIHFFSFRRFNGVKLNPFAVKSPNRRVR